MAAGEPRYICREAKRQQWAREVVWFDGTKTRATIVRTQDRYWAAEVCRLMNEARVRENWGAG